ncbi:MAG: fused MFS/spermidine synthase [Rhodospirillales bacterium]|nr:fused MFS/spermidine synthase [Rhodospirillales bacterium]MCB9995821.1 fused MFS/spermidine synthase [Rhodospirillales bacterium]
MTKSHHLYIPIYTVTLLLSAFLLFLVQPMFGKMVLPLLGGAPAVWNTAMLFFQAMLLAGYAYAHGTARFMSVRMQAVLHLALLVLFLFVLPIAIPEGWTPPTDKDPTLWQLGLMAVAVGGPFFVLSASAPLLQHWFAHTKHADADNPYFLYAASNLGSMTALIAYPFVVEPLYNISQQSIYWAFGYGALILLIALAALVAWPNATKAHSIAHNEKDDDPITWKRRGLWLALAFVPSSLMLGVTTFITTDLATVPLLWILPLALYVTTFIIVFAKKPLISQKETFDYQGLLFIALLTSIAVLPVLNKIAVIVIHLGLFFFTALMCHFELAASRPKPRHLTQFYLIMSLGGALGGFFNAIIAPNIFVVPLEYAIILALGSFMRGSIDPDKSLAAAWSRYKALFKDSKSQFFLKSGTIYVGIVFLTALTSAHFMDLTFEKTIMAGVLILSVFFLISLAMVIDKRWSFGICVAVILFFNPPGFFWGGTLFDSIQHRERNFFGVIRVAVSHEYGTRTLLHGTTIHGTQALDPDKKMIRLSYYSEYSGLKEVFELVGLKEGPQTIAALGLGVGVVSCYTREGRSFDFFEIDPAVIRVAENTEYFTYLSDCGSPYTTILGDARIQLADKPDGSYDMILLDVFSSDSIPVHLLTLESFEMYKSKLKPDGVIAINISNRYLDLKPVIGAAAAKTGFAAYNKFIEEGSIEGLKYNSSDFMALVNRKDDIQYLLDRDWTEVPADPDFRLWTDQYSNIIARFKMLSKNQ